LIFFRDIAKKYKNPADFRKAINQALSTNNAAINSQLSAQIWQISKIADTKYNSVKLSIIFILIAVGASLSLILTVV
jgi:hypothetical protein